MSERSPQHVKMIHSRLNWDWRKENPVELVLLIFIFAILFAIPKQGCGISKDAGINAKLNTAPAVVVPAAPVAAPRG